MHVEHTEKGLEFYFPRQRDLYNVDRAPLNMNWTIFLRRMTAVLRVKTQRKRISSHLKNGCPNSYNYTEQADTVGSSSSKTCFVTSIFAPFLRLIIQNRFHLLLKVLFHSKLIAKSTYRLLKRAAAKTTKPIADMTKARHSSMLPGSTNWRQGGHHRDIYKYTAISRKVVGKKCTRQTRKVIWDTISVTKWHCSCRTYFWRTVNSKPPTIPFGIVACTFSDNFFPNSCRWAGRLYRLLTPRAVHSLCAWRDYKRQSAQGASLRSEIYEKEPRSTKLWPFVISRFHCTFKHNLKVYVHGKIGGKDHNF